MIPTVCWAQDNDCGADAKSILASAYPAAQSVSAYEYSLETDKITLSARSALDSNPYAMVCRRWPSNPQYLLVAVPLIHPQQNEFLVEGDLEILVVETHDLRVRARLRIPKFISDDAIALSRIVFDTAPYRLVAGRSAFGLRASIENSSRANPISQTTLWLYDFDGEKLKPVLEGIVVEQLHGETDTNCAGEFETIKRTLSLLPQKHDNATDILVSSRMQNKVYAPHNGACKESIGKAHTAKHRLVYKNGIYKLPKALERAF